MLASLPVVYYEYSTRSQYAINDPSCCRKYQEQEVKFQEQLFSKFQDIFVGFMRLKTQKMHVFCAHKS